jgi:hypothetical protein
VTNERRVEAACDWDDAMPFGPASLVIASADVPPVSLPGPASIAYAKACTPSDFTDAISVLLRTGAAPAAGL